MVFVSALVLVNCLGISYSVWTEKMDIFSSVSTGQIAPSFSSSYYIQKVQGEGTIAVVQYDETSLTVQGEVYPGYQAFLHYNVRNGGGIPVKWTPTAEQELAGQDQLPDQDELTLQLDQQTEPLNPNSEYADDGNGSPKLGIQADKEGDYNWEMELPFRQWNK